MIQNAQCVLKHPGFLCISDPTWKIQPVSSSRRAFEFSTKHCASNSTISTMKLVVDIGEFEMHCFEIHATEKLASVSNSFMMINNNEPQSELPLRFAIDIAICLRETHKWEFLIFCSQPVLYSTLLAPLAADTARFARTQSHTQTGAICPSLILLAHSALSGDLTHFTCTESHTHTHTHRKVSSARSFSALGRPHSFHSHRITHTQTKHRMASSAHRSLIQHSWRYLLTL